MTSRETQRPGRYRPPRARISEGAPLTPRVDMWSIILVLGLSAMWLLDFPHHGISEYVGRHFPWPVDRSLKWPAVVVERILIEAVICIPAALLLALRLRRFAVAIAVVLSAVFCARVAFDMPTAAPGSAVWRFLWWVAVIHSALLVGATAYFAHRGRPQ